MGKNKIIVTILICFFIIGIFITQVFAKIEGQYEMRQAYKKDNSIIDSLSDKEVEEWIAEMRALKKLMEPPAIYPKEDVDLVNEIIGKLQQREREINTSSGKENGTGQSDEELKKYDITQITAWLTKHTPSELSQGVKETWKKTIENSKESDAYKKQAMNLLEGKTLEETNKETEADRKGQVFYKNPGITTQDTSGGSIDDMITGADDFVSQGTDRIRENKLPEFSNTVYNIALAMGVAVAVIAGGFLGIKFMLGGIEEKAEIKKMLWIYIVGCITVFGSFGIWRLVVTILQKV